MEHMISMFIDNELKIDDKIEFVKKVHDNDGFKDESLALLHQEKLIRSDVVNKVPSVQIKERRKIVSSFFRPLGLMASSAVIAAIILIFVLSPRELNYSPFRFVIYQPDANRVEIAGSFTNWKATPLRKIESTGYWDITINLLKGEHRYVYILEGSQKVTDPTIMARENDDFGGENSILLMEL